MSRVQVQLKNSAVRPGDTISGTVEWTIDGRHDGRVAIRLFWFTQGKGTEDLEVVDETLVESPSRSDSRTFSFTAPSFPWSYAGKLMAITWAVEATVEPGNDADRAVLTLGPDAREVAL